MPLVRVQLSIEFAPMTGRDPAAAARLASTIVAEAFERARLGGRIADRPAVVSTTFPRERRRG